MDKCRYNPRDAPEPILGEKDKIMTRVIEDMEEKRQIPGYNILEPYKYEEEQRR